MNRQRTARARGFTLTELMVVVVIVGILSTIGIAGFRSRIFGAKSAEAAAMVQSIRAAEERHRAENLMYLNVSTAWYPAEPGGRVKRAFFSAGTCSDLGTDDCRWKALNPAVPGPVEFSYRVNAGTPSKPMTEPEACRPAGWSSWPTTQTGNGFSAGANSEHWYVVQAAADVDSDGVFACFVASSRTPNVLAFREGE